MRKTMAAIMARALLMMTLLHLHRGGGGGSPSWSSFLLFAAAAADGDGDGLPSNTTAVAVVVNGKQAMAEVDSAYICATLDWWPPEKCDYGTCSWGHASILNLNLSHPLLRSAIRAFSPLRIRIGGTLQDQVVYEVGKPAEACRGFARNGTALFGFSGGCLPMQRWDALNQFFQGLGCDVAFGLNALYGKRGAKHSLGAWDPSNARDFIRYTYDQGYKIIAWELGNELSGSGVGTSVSPRQYAEDMSSLAKTVKDIYTNKELDSPPLLVAPDGFFDRDWTINFLNGSNRTTLDVVTRHIYNLGAGVDDDLVEKILNPTYLGRDATVYQSMKDTLAKFGPWASLWVGESGGAYNSGHHLVTDAFVFGFWYLDQLGMAATVSTKTYCRQSLIGGNYGLLNTTTFAPNPDYYGALLWHRLMGTKVLSVQATGSTYLRAYAHCTKGDQGATLLLLNLSNDTLMVAPLFTLSTGLGTSRTEYHLTALNDDIHSQTVLLNAQPLEVQVANGTAEIPRLPPRVVQNLTSPVHLHPLSIAFVSFPLQIPACLESKS